MLLYLLFSPYFCANSRSAGHGKIHFSAGAHRGQLDCSYLWVHLCWRITPRAFFSYRYFSGWASSMRSASLNRRAMVNILLMLLFACSFKHWYPVSIAFHHSRFPRSKRNTLEPIFRFLSSAKWQILSYLFTTNLPSGQYL